MKRSIVLLLILGLLAGALVGPAEAKKKKKKKKKATRIERVVEIPYTLGGLGVATPAVTGGICPQTSPGSLECISIPLQAGETFIKIEITDSTGLPPAGFISQGDVDGDGVGDGYGEFCGAHPEAVPLASPGTPVGVSFYYGVCSDGSGVSFPTTGTIKATLSNMP